MKKRYFLLTFVIILSLQSFGQEYDPVIKEGSFWDQLRFLGGVCTEAYTRIEIGNDTVINSTTYKKLRFRGFIENPTDPGYPCPNYYSPLSVTSDFGHLDYAYIRENIAEKKVYIWDSNYNNELILYDFNLKIGDIMVNSYAAYGNDNTLMSIDFDQNGKKRYHFLYGKYYTEGIGYSGGIINFEMVIGVGDIELFCYGNAQNQNNCATVLSTDEFKISNFTIFPNPVKEKISIHINETSTVKIYSLIGQLMNTFQLKNSTELDISTYKKGMYILEISNTQNLKKTLKFIKN